LTPKRLAVGLVVIASVDLKECPRIAVMKPKRWLIYWLQEGLIIVSRTSSQNDLKMVSEGLRHFSRCKGIIA
jgi:hypothetical protein